MASEFKIETIFRAIDRCAPVVLRGKRGEKIKEDPYNTIMSVSLRVKNLPSSKLI